MGRASGLSLFPLLPSVKKIALCRLILPVGFPCVSRVSREGVSSNNPDHLAGFQRLEGIENFGNQRPDILNFVRGGRKNDNPKRKFARVLLVGQVSVNRYESVKFSGDSTEEISILHARHPCHGTVTESCQGNSRVKRFGRHSSRMSPMPGLPTPNPPWYPPKR